MKLMAAGVTFSAAMVKSPSFSRSSSSHKMIIFPAWISWSTSSTVLNAMGYPHPPGSLGNPVSTQQRRHHLALARALVFQPGLQYTLDVLTNHITLEIHGGPDVLAADGRDCRGMGDNRDLKPLGLAGHDRQTDAVHGDGALRDNIPHQGLRGADVIVQGIGLSAFLENGAHAVDVAADEMAAHAIAQP